MASSFEAEGSRLILILGGSFDPLHLGHLHLLCSAQEAIGADVLIFIPCGNPPHKSRTLTLETHRIEMLKLGCQWLERWCESEQSIDSHFKNCDFKKKTTTNSKLVTIDTSEVHKPAPSYTVETLKALKQRYKTDHLLWLMGMDSFNSLHEWHHWREIFNFASLVVADRPEQELSVKPDVEAFLANRFVSPEVLRQCATGRVCRIHIEALAISSTAVREVVKSGGNAESYLAPEVLNYIREHQLYA